MSYFSKLRKAVSSYISDSKEQNPLRQRGCKSELSLEDMLLLTLFYLRHYQTFFMLGKQFGVSESYAFKIFYRFSGILVKVLHLSNRESLMSTDLKTVAIDVTEQSIDRPKKKQKDYYSGKKKRHTIKVQLVVDLMTLEILEVFCAKGKVHDFQILKNSRLVLSRDVIKLADAGYQGI